MKDDTWYFTRGRIIRLGGDNISLNLLGPKNVQVVAMHFQANIDAHVDVLGKMKWLKRSSYLDY